MTGGTVSCGTFSSAHHFLLTDPVATFHERYPGVRVRVVGRNSAEVADAVRDGRLQTGQVALPVEEAGLDVNAPVWTAQGVYVSADPARTAGPVPVERLADAALILAEARWGEQDPTRRWLGEQARQAGFTLEPDVEVELPCAPAP